MSAMFTGGGGGGRRCCHGNIVFAVDVVNIVLHVNDINNNQNFSKNAVQCFKCHCNWPEEVYHSQYY